MRLLSFVCFAAVLSTQASTVVAAEACSLLARSEAAGLLGQPVAQVIPAGPELDEDSGGQVTYCTYRAATSAVILSVTEFSSASEARQQLTKNLVQERLDAEDAKVSEESGLGDKSFYGVSAEGAMYVFLKGSKVVGVAVGVAKADQSAAAKAALRTVAQTVASKV